MTNNTNKHVEVATFSALQNIIKKWTDRKNKEHRSVLKKRVTLGFAILGFIFGVLFDQVYLFLCVTSFTLFLMSPPVLSVSYLFNSKLIIPNSLLLEIIQHDDVRKEMKLAIVGMVNSKSLISFGKVLHTEVATKGGQEKTECGDEFRAIVDELKCSNDHTLTSVDLTVAHALRTLHK